MNDLDKLFDGFKAGRMKYPQPRRETEDVFFGELVARIKALQTKLDAFVDEGRAHTEQTDRMAAARAAKAAKREEAAV